MQGCYSATSAAARPERPWTYSLLRNQDAEELDGESDRSLRICKLPAVFKTAEDQAQ